MAMTSPTEIDSTPPSHHIILPFNLRQNRVFSENSERLFRLFPNTNAVWFDGYFLVFCLDTLPPKPWPTTIAGVQPYFTTDPNDDGPTPPIKRSSKSRLRVSAEINATNLPSARIDDAFKLVLDFFARSEISITEVQYWNHFFVIVLENEDTDLAEVPSAIGRCNCFYLFENEMGRPLDGATPTQLKESVPVDETQIGCRVYMNHPFLGDSEGTCGPHGRMRIPNDDPNAPERQWIKTRWLYWGQGSSDHLEDGLCGSAIWNDDGNVIGFVRYAPRSGHFRDWCLAVASDNVIERGLKMAVTANL